jgi:predicted DNA-binding transcriptional regulator YafY
LTHPIWYGGGMKNQKTAAKTRISRLTTERQRARVSDGRSVKRHTWERMYRIYGWLKNGEYPNCARVVAEFEVERKTALRDIAFMQDRMEMPIAYDDLRHGYYFDGPAPEFGPVALSERDLFGLCFMGKALEQFRGTTVGRPLEALLSRVSRQLDDGERFTLQSLEDVMSVRPVAAEDGDVPLFELVSRGVGQRRVLKFQYRKPGEKWAEPRRVHPYHLLQFDNRWYLLAHDLARKAVRTFVLGRMREAVLLDDHFQKPKDFDPRKMLDGSLGVMSGKGDYQVVIEMDAWLTDVLRGRRWHPSQEVAELPGGGSQVRMRLSGLEEIEQHVLSWGTHAHVVGPQDLRERVGTVAAELVKRYGEDVNRETRNGRRGSAQKDTERT